MPELCQICHKKAPGAWDLYKEFTGICVECALKHGEDWREKFSDNYPKIPVDEEL